MIESERGATVLELVRVSTAEQAAEDRAGIARQEEDNRRTVERYALRTVRKLTIKDVSGTNTSRSPEIQNVLIPLMRSREITGVVVSDLDRLMRPDNFDDYALLQRFKENGVRIYTADNVIDFNTRTGFLMGGMKATIAGDDLSGIKKKCADGKEAKRIQGKHPHAGITLPKGITFDRKADAFALTRDISDVREMFRLFVVERWSLSRLGKRFRMTPRGAAILLANPLYFGYRVWDQKRGDKYHKPDGRQPDRKKVKRAPDEIIVKRVFDASPVDPDLFSAAQGILNVIRKDHTSRREIWPDRFYYSGLLECADDGSPLHSRGGATRGKEDYHLCAKRRSGAGCRAPYANRARLYHSLDSFVSEILGNRRALEGMLSRWVKGDAGRLRLAERETQVNQELRGLTAKRGRFLALYGDGNYTREELDTLIDPLTAKIEGLRGELAQIERDKRVIDQGTVRRTASLLVGALREYRFLLPGQKRRLLSRAGITFKVRGEAVCGVRMRCHIGEPVPVWVSASGIASGGKISRFISDGKAGPVQFVSVELTPPYTRPMTPILNRLGLPVRETYTTGDACRVLGIRPDLYRWRERRGVYPEAPRGADGRRVFTLAALEALRRESRAVPA